MILAATGHEAVDRFLEAPDFKAIRIAGWEQLLEQVPTASHVVLSDRIGGLPPWHEIRDAVERHSTTRWMIWLPEGMQNAAEILSNADLVFGDLAADRLTTWLQKDWSPNRPNLVLSKQWVVWRPRFDFNQSIMSWLGTEANRQHGAGCWVDLDWHNGHLTARWDPDAWTHANLVYGKLKARRTKEGWLVPAPPPWEIVYEIPQAAEIQGLMRRDYKWCGMDLGADLRPPLAMRAIEAVSQVIILLDEPWTKVLDEGLKMLKAINPGLSVLGLGGSIDVARAIQEIGTWVPWEVPVTRSWRHRFFGKWSSIRQHQP